MCCILCNSFLWAVWKLMFSAKNGGKLPWKEWVHTTCSFSPMLLGSLLDLLRTSLDLQRRSLIDQTAWPHSEPSSGWSLLDLNQVGLALSPGQKNSLDKWQRYYESLKGNMKHWYLETYWRNIEEILKKYWRNIEEILKIEKIFKYFITLIET